MMTAGMYLTLGFYAVALCGAVITPIVMFIQSRRRQHSVWLALLAAFLAPFAWITVLVTVTLTLRWLFDAVRTAVNAVVA